MSSLGYTERLKLEKLFRMSNGFVCDFSDRTFREFVIKSTGVDVYTEEYSQEGTSKANRLRVFWKKGSDEIVAKLIHALLEYWKNSNLISGGDVQLIDQNLYLEGLKIVENLRLAGVDGLFTVLTKGSGYGGHVSSDQLGSAQIFNFKDSEFNLVNQGDMIRGDKNTLEPSADLPLWFKWLSGIVGVLGILWGVYYNPDSQMASIVLTSGEIKNVLATTTPNLADIFLKTNSMLDLDKENFLKDYKGGHVYAVGAKFENINSLGEGFIVRMKIEQNLVGCEFGPNFRKELLLLKREDELDFYGKFTGGGLNGYGPVNPWFITDCSLLR